MAQNTIGLLICVLYYWVTTISWIFIHSNQNTPWHWRQRDFGLKTSLIPPGCLTSAFESWFEHSWVHGPESALKLAMHIYSYSLTINGLWWSYMYVNNFLKVSRICLVLQCISYPHLLYNTVTGEVRWIHNHW